jgi:phasin family protein
MVTATNANSSTEAKTGGFTGFKVPNIDTNAILDSYKKNLEILGLVNKMSIEVCNGITKLQTAFVKQFISDLGGVAEKSGKPAEALAKFSEVTRDAAVKAIGNSKQISDIIVASNNELTAAIAKRFKDSIEEVKNVVNPK